MRLREWKDSGGDKIDLSKFNTTAHTTSSNSSVPTNTPAASNIPYKDKFKKLLDYHMAHPSSIRKVISQEISRLFEDDQLATFTFNEILEGLKPLSLVAYYFKTSGHWRIFVYIDTARVEVIDSFQSGYNKGFNKLISELGSASQILNLNLPPKSSKEFQELLEAADSSTTDFQLCERQDSTRKKVSINNSDTASNSIADDFKTYENLWN